MVTELFSNAATTTLTAGIDNSVTSLTVTSSALFPTPVAATSQFRVLVGTEIMVVTAVSGTTWTVTRGAESTVASSHSSGDTVTQIVTAAALGAFHQGAASSVGFSSTPLVWLAGRYYGANMFSTSSTVAAAGGRCYLYPLYLSRPRAIDRIAVNQTVVGTATHVGRVGIYDSHPDTYLPTTVLVDGGSFLVDVASPVVKEVTVSTTISGLVWIAFTCQSGTFTAWNSSMTPNIVGNTTASSPQASNYGYLDAVPATSALPSMVGASLTWFGGTHPAVVVRAV